MSESPYAPPRTELTHTEQRSVSNRTLLRSWAVYFLIVSIVSIAFNAIWVMFLAMWVPVHDFGAYQLSLIGIPFLLTALVSWLTFRWVVRRFVLAE